jgi:hypothetical protein
MGSLGEMQPGVREVTALKELNLTPSGGVVGHRVLPEGVTGEIGKTIECGSTA